MDFFIIQKNKKTLKNSAKKSSLLKCTFMLCVRREIMKNKKGFTIEELVIVISVIAILAAVLIPTFSGLVKKANSSADQQAARNTH